MYTTSTGVFQGVDGPHRPFPALEGRTHHAAAGARRAPSGWVGGDAGADCRIGAPARAEQPQQWQATVQRRAKEAAPRAQPAGGPGKKSGGQKGHPGATLRQSETPDAVIDHYPPSCAACGAPLTAAMATGYVARQVFDLPEPRPLVVTEYRAHDCRCAACGAQTRAAFPDGVMAPVA